MPATSDLQIVVWVENAAGEVVDTLFVTDAVGKRGLGNRPGRFDFNSAFRWEAGRRVTTFPVWAHRRSVSYPKVIHQTDYDENDLETAIAVSGTDPYYCNFWSWQTADEQQVCPEPGYTDLGRLSKSEVSRYPPRNDVVRGQWDHADVELYADLNDLDAVSGATPVGSALHTISWFVPGNVAPGEYVVWVEVSREFDQNAFHDYPSPVNVAFGEFGRPYRGQPSTLWSTPFVVGGAAGVTKAADYLGYGAPDGADGDVRPADGTITTAATRIAGLQVIVDAPAILPAPPTPELIVIDTTSAEIAATSGITLRLATVPFSRQIFATTGRQVTAPSLADLEPGTHYWLAAAVPDDCGAWSELAIIEFDTPPAPAGCGCSTTTSTHTWWPALALLCLLRRQRRISPARRG